MNLESSLRKYLTRATTTDTTYSCEVSFHRDLTEEELNFMNKQMQGKSKIIICYPCDTCAEKTNGKERYHIDRIRV